MNFENDTFNGDWIERYKTHHNRHGDHREASKEATQDMINMGWRYDNKKGWDNKFLHMTDDETGEEKKKQRDDYSKRKTKDPRWISHKA